MANQTFKQEIVADGKTFIVEGVIGIDDVKITLKEGPPVPPEDPKVPPMGVILHGGWGGNVDAKTWKVVNMKTPPEQFKIVDDKGVNIMTNIKTKEAADALVKYFQTHKFPPDVVGPPPDPDPNPNPNPTPKGELDAQGVRMIYAPKVGGQVVTAAQTNQKESEHNTGTRSSLYSNDPYSATSGELTECFIMDLSDSNEQNAPKILSGGHTGSGEGDETRQGCCYAIGVNENGSLHLAKEWPYHPVTPKAYDKINYVDPAWKTIGNIKNKFTPMKIIYYPKEGGTYIEWWFDKKGLESGKLENDWQQMAWAHDKGDWGEKFGPALVENQGLKYKGKVLGFYIRIDTPKKPVQFSHQGMHELEIPVKKVRTGIEIT